MKQVKILLTFLLVTSLNWYSSGVNTGSGLVLHHASINAATGLITINPTAPVQSTYTFDVSALSFANQQAATNYFSRYTEHEYIAISVNLQTDVATMTLQNAKVADATLSVAKWNQILKMANED